MTGMEWLSRVPLTFECVTFAPLLSLSLLFPIGIICSVEDFLTFATASSKRRATATVVL